MASRSGQLAVRIVVAIVICYATWLGMMAVHEFGHMIGAWLTGGRVVSVSIPVFGFSQTVVHPNPRELVVVWCGPVIGTIIPISIVLIWRAARRAVPDVLTFFAGFCAVANGAYIGLGWLTHSGDAGDLRRLGTPRWAMIAFGFACVAIGMTCWHRTRALTIAFWRTQG
jgi:hypothetical protein